jgi:hypothetical protein
MVLKVRFCPFKSIFGRGLSEISGFALLFLKKLG